MKNRKIETKEDFVQEYQSLLGDINANIDNLAQYQKTSMESPTTELAEKLNRLKLHRKKLEDMLALYADVNESEWVTARPAAQEIFQAALHEWRQASKTLA